MIPPASMADTIRYQNDLGVRYEADVLIAGGGPAGIAAALAAARQGRAVRLIGPGACSGHFARWASPGTPPSAPISAGTMTSSIRWRRRGAAACSSGLRR